MQTVGGLPCGKYIHLGEDCHDRAATLARLKPVALADAERYVTERLRFLDPMLESSHLTTAMLPNGDLVYSGFDVVQLDASHQSIKMVYDAVHSFLFNVEIAWTEAIGELMLREDDSESGDLAVLSQRLVRSRSAGPPIESNSVVFSELQSGAERRQLCGEDGAIGDSAMFVVDFVDQDDLHPYRPDERLRKDVTGAISLKAYPRKELCRQGDIENGSVVVVMAQAYSGRLHRSALSTESPDDFSLLSNFWFRTMLSTVDALVKSGGVTPTSDSGALDVSV